MATSSARAIQIINTGDVVANQTYNAAANAASSGANELKNLSTGANTITAPTGGSTLSGVTIIPPTGNTVVLTLKGISGDTGILIHKTSPTSLGLDSSVTTFVINAASAVTGVRFIWT